MGDAPAPPGGLRVLLVEDSFVASEMIAATVEGIGHQVVGRAARGLADFFRAVQGCKSDSALKRRAAELNR